jgi:hypothetical protein
MKMLDATKWDYPIHKPNRERSRRELDNGILVREPNERTTFIEVQQYLDFTYGASSVVIKLPDESTVKLVVGADGRVFFQVPFDS